MTRTSEQISERPPRGGLSIPATGDVRYWPIADMDCGTAHVRFRGKADMTFCAAHVGFVGRAETLAARLHGDAAAIAVTRQ